MVAFDSSALPSAGTCKACEASGRSWHDYRNDCGGAPSDSYGWISYCHRAQKTGIVPEGFRKIGETDTSAWILIEDDLAKGDGVTAHDAATRAFLARQGGRESDGWLQDVDAPRWFEAFVDELELTQSKHSTYAREGLDYIAKRGLEVGPDFRPNPTAEEWRAAAENASRRTGLPYRPHPHAQLGPGVLQILRGPDGRPRTVKVRPAKATGQSKHLNPPKTSTRCGFYGWDDLSLRDVVIVEQPIGAAFAVKHLGKAAIAMGGRTISQNDRDFAIEALVERLRKTGGRVIAANDFGDLVDDSRTDDVRKSATSLVSNVFAEVLRRSPGAKFGALVWDNASKGDDLDAAIGRGEELRTVSINDWFPMWNWADHEEGAARLHATRIVMQDSSLRIGVRPEFMRWDESGVVRMFTDSRELAEEAPGPTVFLPGLSSRPGTSDGYAKQAMEDVAARVGAKMLENGEMLVVTAGEKRFQRKLELGNLLTATRRAAPGIGVRFDRAGELLTADAFAATFADPKAAEWFMSEWRNGPAERPEGLPTTVEAARELFAREVDVDTDETLFVAGSPGTGKTQMLIERVVESPNQSWFIEVPTRDVVKEIANRVRVVAGDKTITVLERYGASEEHGTCLDESLRRSNEALANHGCMGCQHRSMCSEKPGMHRYETKLRRNVLHQEAGKVVVVGATGSLAAALNEFPDPGSVRAIVDDGDTTASMLRSRTTVLADLREALNGDGANSLGWTSGNHGIANLEMLYEGWLSTESARSRTDHDRPNPVPALIVGKLVQLIGAYLESGASLLDRSPMTEAHELLERLPVIRDAIRNGNHGIFAKEYDEEERSTSTLNLRRLVIEILHTELHGHRVFVSPADTGSIQIDIPVPDVVRAAREGRMTYSNVGRLPSLLCEFVSARPVSIEVAPERSRLVRINGSFCRGRTGSDWREEQEAKTQAIVEGIMREAADGGRLLEFAPPGATLRKRLSITHQDTALMLRGSASPAPPGVVCYHGWYGADSSATNNFEDYDVAVVRVRLLPEHEYHKQAARVLAIRGVSWEELDEDDPLRIRAIGEVREFDVRHAIVNACGRPRPGTSDVVVFVLYDRPVSGQFEDGVIDEDEFAAKLGIDLAPDADPMRLEEKNTKAIAADHCCWQHFGKFVGSYGVRPTEADLIASLAQARNEGDESATVDSDRIQRVVSYTQPGVDYAIPNYWGVTPIPDNPQDSTMYGLRDSPIELSGSGATSPKYLSNVAPNPDSWEELPTLSPSQLLANASHEPLVVAIESAVAAHPEITDPFSGLGPESIKRVIRRYRADKTVLQCLENRAAGKPEPELPHNATARNRVRAFVAAAVVLERQQRTVLPPEEIRMLLRVDDVMIRHLEDRLADVQTQTDGRPPTHLTRELIAATGTDGLELSRSAVRWRDGVPP